MLYVKYALYFQYEILCVVVRYYLLMILLNISANAIWLLFAILMRMNFLLNIQLIKASLLNWLRCNSINCMWH